MKVLRQWMRAGDVMMNEGDEIEVDDG